MEKQASGLFVASTGQHVGKTTTCLGLFSALEKQYSQIGFIKPVGQEHVQLNDEGPVDKDVLVFRSRFNLDHEGVTMSPVLFPRGFTRRYLDGEIATEPLEQRIKDAFEKLRGNSRWVLAEGTGHVGVGSVTNLNNARVAALLGLPTVLIASGGVGSAFDMLALNKCMFDRHGVPLVGVILNRVRSDKRDMMIEYVGKALKRWDVPLLGAVPVDELLGNPCMNDFEELFGVELMTGREQRYRHFDQIRLIATTIEEHEQLMTPRQLTITPATREDIIASTLSKLRKDRHGSVQRLMEPGLILTGAYRPSTKIVEELADAEVPMLYVSTNSFTAMQMISSYTAKIDAEDTQKLNRAIEIVEANVDFELLLDRLGA